MEKCKKWIALALILAGGFSVACTEEDQSDFDAMAQEQLPLPFDREFAEAQTSNGSSRFAWYNKVYVLEHVVEVEPDVNLHVIEKFTFQALTRWPWRTVLMMPPTLVTNEFYDAQIEGDTGFNALERMAKAGYFAFAVSYEGYGESTAPKDGRTVTFERCLEHMGTLVEIIRSARYAPHVDLMGASLGSYLAMALGGVESPIPEEHVGRVILTSMPYRNFSPFVSQYVFTPQLGQLLSSLPYIQTDPSMYAIMMTQVDPAAMGWANSAFPGVYATGPTLEAFDLPVHPAKNARAPALVIWGDQDTMHTADDVDAFVSEYGGPVELLVTEGGGHSPLFEPQREVVWNRIGGFLNFE